MVAHVEAMFWCNRARVPPYVKTAGGVSGMEPSSCVRSGEATVMGAPAVQISKRAITSSRDRSSLR